MVCGRYSCFINILALIALFMVAEMWIGGLVLAETVGVWAAALVSIGIAIATLACLFTESREEDLFLKMDSSSSQVDSLTARELERDRANEKTPQLTSVSSEKESTENQPLIATAT